MSETDEKPAGFLGGIPPLPLLIFAAIDLMLAFFLLVDGGFTIHFALVAVIGVGLAVLGLMGLRRSSEEASGGEAPG
jgi:hypothetical protein